MTLIAADHLVYLRSGRHGCGFTRNRGVIQNAQDPCLWSVLLRLESLGVCRFGSLFVFFVLLHDSFQILLPGLR